VDLFHLHLGLSRARSSILKIFRNIFYLHIARAFGGRQNILAVGLTTFKPRAIVLKMLICFFFFSDAALSSWLLLFNIRQMAPLNKMNY